MLLNTAIQTREAPHRLPGISTVVGRKRVLYVAHYHPSQRPGGAQGYALELYEAMRSSREFEPIFLARGVAESSSSYAGGLIRPANRDPNQYLVHVGPEQYDWFNTTARDKHTITRDIRDFLLAFRPDVVHFQHIVGLGVDLVREVRNTLPTTPIVFTLHEFLAICPRDGQMLRRTDNSLCDHATPARCQECFPHIPAQDMFMRQRLIQSHLSLVDLFLAPSRFLLERYIQWGIPREKIRFLENGRLPAAPFQEPTRNGARNRFGFFGQLLLYKGVLVLLEAMQLLESDSRRPFFKRFRRHGSRLDEYGQVANGADSPGAHLWIHGTGLEHQLPDFRDEFERHVRAIRSRVTFAGEYQPSDLPRLMANVDWVIVPSIWWENSPLVIQEAFQYGRPVICSGIGGMAEKVTHEVNGLQFRAGDPGELANAISRAMQTPGLWESLRNGIPDVCRIDDHAAELSKIYRGLLEHRVSRG